MLTFIYVYGIIVYYIILLYYYRLFKIEIENEIENQD